MAMSVTVTLTAEEAASKARSLAVERDQSRSRNLLITMCRLSTSLDLTRGTMDTLRRQEPLVVRRRREVQAGTPSVEVSITRAKMDCRTIHSPTIAFNNPIPTFDLIFK